MPSKRRVETLEEKLRNALSPAYGLAEIVLIKSEDPRLKRVIKQVARQALKNKRKIDTILNRMEKRHNTTNNGRTKK